MKTLNDYISEKANFIVKKHVSNTTNEITLNDLHDGDYFVCKFMMGTHGKQTPAVMYGKVKSIKDSDDLKHKVIKTYYGVCGNNDIDLNATFHIHSNEIYEPNDEQRSILNEIDKHVKQNHKGVKREFTIGKVNKYGKIEFKH